MQHIAQVGSRGRLVAGLLWGLGRGRHMTASWLGTACVSAPEPNCLFSALLCRRPSIVSMEDYEADRDSLQRMIDDFQVS